MIESGAKFVIGDGRTMRYITIIESTNSPIKKSNDIWYNVKDDNTEEILTLPRCYIADYGVEC